MGRAPGVEEFGMTVSRKDDVQDAQVSQEGRIPGATAAVEPTVRRVMPNSSVPGAVSVKIAHQ